MERDRVEMSVGSEQVNGDHVVNGNATNGASMNIKSQATTFSAAPPVNATTTSNTNGEIAPLKREAGEVVQAVGSILQDAPLELLQALSSEFYLPMAKLISRSAQSCWNDLLALVERLASMPVSTTNTQNAGTVVNDQSKTNLDKKDLLLNFAKEHKDIFIKMLVLLQWSRKSDEVRKTIELNLWLQQRRQAFNNATGIVGAMLRGLADSQIPNPDLSTASEVLATGTVSSMPKLDYVPLPPLSPHRILRLLKRLNTILCTRMALAEDVPHQLQDFHIHDGRVTFAVKDEFSFDVSVASEDPQAKFGIVDFDFLFSPAPSIPDGVRAEVSFIANSALDKDGFLGVYDFLHDLTLSYKLSELASQARALSQGLWNGHLRVEVLRRTLIVQYWPRISVAKSWIQIGIHSGRGGDTTAVALVVPELKLQWLREGKPASSESINMNLAVLSIENILHQVIAQHMNYQLDAMYENLLSLPLYSSGELELVQTASLEDPGDCTLDVHLSGADVLHISIEPVGGLLIVSPVNERYNKVQFDMARSKNMIEDFVRQIPSLWSATAESNLMRSLSNSRWQRLEHVKINLSEAEKLYGQTVTRVSCIRIQEWTTEWMVTVTQSVAGDLWWLTQSLHPNTLAGSRTTKIVENHPLHLTGRPSPAYLERLAEHATGVIALQCNAEYLNKNKFAWRLPDIPAFDQENKLPALQFSRNNLANAHSRNLTGRRLKKGSKIQADTASLVHLTYHGIEMISKKVVMIARLALVVDPAVLSDLASSDLDRSIAIIPERQQLMIKVESAACTPVIGVLLSKLAHLESIVACATAVKKSSEHVLQSLSFQGISILYHRDPDLSLRIDFGQHPDDLSASFLPADSNPQRSLARWVVQSMKRKVHNPSENLSNIFVVLRMTRPIMTYLYNIQTPVNSGHNGTSKTSDHLRVHVVHRQPTAYGLQYFADSSNFTHDEVGPETPKKLLARFEILAVTRGDRLMWMVRPAIEEFNTYTRPSYTSKTLRERLAQDIFKKQSPVWLALDGGAACPSDHPDRLLSAIHDTIVSWVKEMVKPETGDESEAIASAAVGNGSNLNSVDAKKPTQSNALPQKGQGVPQQLNKMPRPHQSANQQRPQSFNNKKQTPRTEIIEIE